MPNKMSEDGKVEIVAGYTFDDVEIENETTTHKLFESVMTLTSFKKNIVLASVSAA